MAAKRSRLHTHEIGFLKPGIVEKPVEFFAKSSGLSGTVTEGGIFSADIAGRCNRKRELCSFTWSGTITSSYRQKLSRLEPGLDACAPASPTRPLLVVDREAA